VTFTLVEFERGRRTETRSRRVTKFGALVPQGIGRIPLGRSPAVARLAVGLQRNPPLRTGQWGVKMNSVATCVGVGWREVTLCWSMGACFGYQSRETPALALTRRQ
jgi:hypothetical protein